MPPQIEEATLPDIEPLAVSIEDAGKMLGGVSRTHIYREIAAGTLKRVKIGKRAMVTTESLRRRVEQAA